MLITTVILAVATAVSPEVPAGPQYDSPEAREIVERILAAHRGMAPLEGATTLSLEHSHRVANDRTSSRNHAILNYSLSNEFDESRMEMPEDATLDMSSHLRAGARN